MRYLAIVLLVIGVIWASTIDAEMTQEKFSDETIEALYNAMGTIPYMTYLDIKGDIITITIDKRK